MTKPTRKCAIGGAGMGLGLAAGYLMIQQLWVMWRLLQADPVQTLSTQKNEGAVGVSYQERQECEQYTTQHTVQDGIERVVFRPHAPRFATPILFQHGMWHGVWCWRRWQARFAAWGWETHAYSLPGHGRSPAQRAIKRCTLDYYLSFLKAKIDRMERPPVVIGHSMGGALIQWYLKYVADLPAAVLVAPWVSHSMFADGLLPLVRRDPLGVLLMTLSWDATPLIRTAERAAECFISEEALISPEELRARLGPESALVLYQHNPPFWHPPLEVATPMLWLAGGADTLLPEPAERRSAAHYGADYVAVPGAGHNIMMEPSQRETAEIIHNWLIERGIA